MAEEPNRIEGEARGARISGGESGGGGGGVQYLCARDDLDLAHRLHLCSEGLDNGGADVGSRWVAVGALDRVTAELRDLAEVDAVRLEERDGFRAVVLPSVHSFAAAAAAASAAAAAAAAAAAGGGGGAAAAAAAGIMVDMGPSGQLGSRTEAEERG